MRRVLSILVIVLVLCGCSQSNEQMDQALNLRNHILNGPGCAFEVMVTADFQDKYYTFGMACRSDTIGNITFEITAPESISGISGIITANEGKLTFDDQILLFPLMAEGQITPVSAPWLFLNSLKTGYINAVENHQDTFYLQIDDSYVDDTIKQNIHIKDGWPVFAEIFWQGRRVVTMDVKGFRIL